MRLVFVLSVVALFIVCSFSRADTITTPAGTRIETGPAVRSMPAKVYVQAPPKIVYTAPPIRYVEAPPVYATPPVTFARPTVGNTFGVAGGVKTTVYADGTVRRRGVVQRTWGFFFGD